MNRLVEKTALSPWDVCSEQPYLDWRARKLDISSTSPQPEFVELRNLADPSEKECGALIKRCDRANFALYSVKKPFSDPDTVLGELRKFTSRLRLDIAERHRSAGSGGIVALTVSDAPGQRGYIPYSRKSMNWHTDGYYNGPDDQVRSMVLHCVRPAASGGANQLFDPEIAYIRLRDENPEFVTALMHPEAMTIPENREPDGSLRPASIGPVFSVNAETGHLAMRYTARTRSIGWRNDRTTAMAIEFLKILLEDGDPLMHTVRLAAGQGILCNNVLHNRTGFDPDTDDVSDRLVFRIRFHNRLSGI